MGEELPIPAEITGVDSSKSNTPQSKSLMTVEGDIVLSDQRAVDPALSRIADAVTEKYRLELGINIDPTKPRIG